MSKQNNLYSMSFQTWIKYNFKELQNSINKNSEKFFYFFIYLFINELFIYKYGLRQDYINVFILVALYPILIFGIYQIISNNFLYQKNFKIAFYVLIVAFLFLLNNAADPNKLNVDRWSAMNVGIHALLNGNYPYTAIDHLQGRTSNLPGLMLIGIPFYFLKDVGLLQIAIFVTFLYIIESKFKNNKTKFLIISLLLFSPSFLWEVTVKSDLMSNLFLVVFFSIIIWRLIDRNIQINPYFLGILTSVLVLTRMIVLLPIIVLLFPIFIKENFQFQIKLVFSTLLMSTLLIFIAIINCPNFETLKLYNPLNLQAKHTPIWLNILVFILAFILSFKVKNLYSFLKLSFYLISIPVFYSFILSLIDIGWKKIILESGFDISYFGMLIPFLTIIIPLSFSNKINLIAE